MTYTPFVFARTITPDLVDSKGRVSERSLVTLCESARMEMLALLGWSSRHYLETYNLNVVLARIQGELICSPLLFEPVLLVVALSKLGAGSLSLLHEIRGQDGSLYYRLRIVEGCFDRNQGAVTLLHEDMKRQTRPALMPPGWEFNEATLAALKPLPTAVGLTLIAAPPEVQRPHSVSCDYLVRVNFAHTELRGGRCREDALALFCDQAFAAYLKARGLLPQVGAACPWVVRTLSGKITACPVLGTQVKVTLKVRRHEPNLVLVGAQLYGADELLYEQEAQLEVTAALFHGLGEKDE